MIDYKGATLSYGFIEMIDLFNRMEKALEYPNCEGYSDRKRILEYYNQKFNHLMQVI